MAANQTNKKEGPAKHGQGMNYKMTSHTEDQTKKTEGEGGRKKKGERGGKAAKGEERVGTGFARGGQQVKMGGD